MPSVESELDDFLSVAPDVERLVADIEARARAYRCGVAYRVVNL
jgi:hypothetical protein